MSVKTGVLVITRHGQAVENEHGISSDDVDRLDDSSGTILRMYDQTQAALGEIVRGGNYSLSDAIVEHSDKDRTIYTAKARLAGAFGLTPIPQTQGDLDRLDFKDVRFHEQADLGYNNLKFNMDFANANRGWNEYNDRWIADRDATVLEGRPITSYNDLVSSRERYLKGAFDHMAHWAARRVKVLSTYGLITEALTIVAVESVTGKGSITDFDQIGGRYEQGDVSVITFERDERSGDSANGWLHRNGEKYEVDMGKLMNFDSGKRRFPERGRR